MDPPLASMRAGLLAYAHTWVALGASDGHSRGGFRLRSRAVWQCFCGVGAYDVTSNVARPARVLIDAPVAQLVAGARDGDERCWDALVDRFSALIWTVARGFRMTTADAAEVTQTTWLRLAEHLWRIETPDRLAAWLVTTTRRECLRHRRLQ